MSSTFQLLSEDLIGKLGISLTAGLLHQLANEESLQLVFAPTEGFHFLWVSRQQRIDDGFNRRRVGDHSQPAFINNRLG